MNIHNNQLFWCENKGFYGAHPHMGMKRGPMSPWDSAKVRHHREKHVYKADCAYSCIYIYGVYVYANVLCSKRYILCILHGVYVNVYVTVYTYIYIYAGVCVYVIAFICNYMYV